MPGVEGKPATMSLAFLTIVAGVALSAGIVAGVAVLIVAAAVGLVLLCGINGTRAFGALTHALRD